MPHHQHKFANKREVSARRAADTAYMADRSCGVIGWLTNNGLSLCCNWPSTHPTILCC